MTNEQIAKFKFDLYNISGGDFDATDDEAAALLVIAELAARPVTPAPTLSEAEFTEWFAKNYYGEVVFHDPAWHAKSIYRRARNPASAPEALSDEQIEKGWRDTFSTDNPYCPCNLKSFTKAVRWAERALAAPSTPAAVSAETKGYAGYIAAIVETWVEICLRDSKDWRPALASVIERRLWAHPAAPSTPAAEPVAYRYKDARGHWRYVGYPFTPGWDMPSNIRHEPLYASQDAATQAQASDHTEQALGMVCEWSYESDPTDAWNTGCGNMHCFTEGGPEENDFRYCCYCGGGLALKGVAP